MTTHGYSAMQAEVFWALSYDGYRRLAGSPEKLDELLVGARNSYQGQGRVPKWCGVDFLRAWAFYLVRADRFHGGGTLLDEWDSVLNTLRGHPDATGADLPPVRAGADILLPSTFSAEPKQHKHSDFLIAKQARTWEPHVAPVNQFVDRIRIEIAQEWEDEYGEQAVPVFVPYVDPDSGGVKARVLFLLESPAGPAALGSGMLSADNNDETAKNVWRAYEASRLPRTFGLHWNAVPWYVGDGKKNAPVTTADVERGRHFLDQLLDLAPEISVVLALGKRARQSISTWATELTTRGVRVINAPHPSPIPAASTKGRSLQQFNAAVAQAFALAQRTDR